MKKKLIVLASILILSTTPVAAKTVVKDTTAGYTIKVQQSKYGTRIRWNGRTIRYYDGFTAKVKLVYEKKLTLKMLIHRKNKVLYIEKVKGKVINNSLDGRTSCGRYICYQRLDGKVKKGDIVITYYVYNPYTNYDDDRDERYDVIIRKGK